MMTVKYKRLFLILFTGLALLLIPLIAMQFSSEVDWQLNDFIIAGILLISTGLSIELVLRKVKGKQNRLILSAIIIIILLLIYIELAVGIFGTPFAGS